MPQPPRIEQNLAPGATPTNHEPGSPDANRAFSSDARPPAVTPATMGGVIDRRTGLDRREVEAVLAKLSAAEGAPSGTGLDRRRGPGRRLSDFTRAAEEGQMTQEQFLFLMAIDAFKKANAKQFPSWTDVLEVIRLLGYRKTMPMELTLRAAEDWREAPDAPSNVRTERQVRRARGEAA